MSKDPKFTTMGDRGPEMKPEEQYPLLKVDGGGDSPPMHAVLAPGWGVQCSRKSSWCSRWPEIMTACWMTMILFGISFLVFYALGMGSYHRQQFVFVNCNSSRPGSNVFYHHLMQRGDQVPFLRHSEYLSNMAAQYPYLHFNVFFLIDDSYTARPKQNRYINKLIPYYPVYGSYNYKTDENYQQALIEFQSRFQNVNVTVMPLSKYMARTPLRFKWRMIPTSYLPFYARVFSVWEKGGIGMDLSLQNEYDDNLGSRRKAAILKQHNDGINPEAYVNALNKIDKEEDTAIFAMVFGLFNRFLNETRSFINRTLTFSPTIETKPDVLVRTHRSKRDTSERTIDTTNLPEVSNSTVENVKQGNSTASVPLIIPPHLDLELLNNTFLPNVNSSKINSTSASQVVLFYDFQIVSDNVGPSYFISDPMVLSEFAPVAVKSRGSRDVKRLPSSHLLSIDGDGTFVAASSRLHPFLGHLISSGCQRMAPKFAIQESILSQCSGLLREDFYCSNIYIL